MKTSIFHSRGPTNIQNECKIKVATSDACKKPGKHNEKECTSSQEAPNIYEKYEEVTIWEGWGAPRNLGKYMNVNDFGGPRLQKNMKS